MDREKFVQASVRIRNLEKKLLTKIQFERLYEADDLQDSIRHLNETVYSEDLATNGVWSFTAFYVCFNILIIAGVVVKLVKSRVVQKYK